jgi:hypothetical protein
MLTNTTDRIADAILDLINSRPRSPSRRDIADLIADHLDQAAPDARAAYLGSDWARLVGDYLKEVSRPRTDHDHDALNARLEADTRAILDKPVHTFKDLVVLAAICTHWSDPPPAHIVAERDPAFCLEFAAYARLVVGVLELAGLKFDWEGRLL